MTEQPALDAVPEEILPFVLDLGVVVAGDDMEGTT